MVVGVLIKTLQNAPLEPLTHPIIRKTESIRNRQVNGSAKGEEGISAQLQRDLGVGKYKTALYLNHRIREAISEGAIRQLGGMVEIDETSVAGWGRRPKTFTTARNKSKS
jgi:hypothetical protein